MITSKISLWGIFLVAWLAACGHNRHVLYQHMPEADKELFDRTRRFMTDRQEEKFLLKKDSQSRRDMVRDMHIHDRLKKFPPHELDAIMAGRLVPGMGSEAVFLSWGRPKEIERRTVDGVPTERWRFVRGDKDGKVRDKYVYFLKGLVTEIGDD